MLRVASEQAVHAEGGNQASSSWSVKWHSRARRNEALRIFGGRTASSPSTARKSPRAGFASSQQCRQSTGWSSNPAAECSRHTTRGSSGWSIAWVRRRPRTVSWRSGPGVPMASTTDDGCLPVARETTSYTSCSTRPASSTMARVKSNPSRRLGTAGRTWNDHPRAGTVRASAYTWTRRSRSGWSSTILAACRWQRAAWRSSVATTTTPAPSSPASSSYRARTAVMEVLPRPRGSIHPANRGRGLASQVEAIRDRCQGRRRRGLRTPWPRGTRM